jgi:ABC-type transport system involved in multi-copper enzyme maturation permease subunit
VKNAFRIAADSIRALLHQRLLLALMLVTLGMTVIASISLGNTQQRIRAQFEAEPGPTPMPGMEKMSELDQKRMRERLETTGSMFQAFFYMTASFCGAVVALFIFCTAVASEIRRGTIRVTLTKPVSRTQFLLGKYLGGVAVMLTYWVLMSAALVLFTRSQQSELSPAVPFAPWLMFCQHLMLGSVGLLLSLYLHPLLAGVVAFFASASFLSPPNPLFFLLPSYNRFDLFGDILTGALVRGRDVVLLSLYALDFTAIMLLLAVWRFRRKELV